MTASELAFLALGLLLGAAAGAALFTVLRIRLPGREIKVTVTRDALPRRSETLSHDAFVTSPGEPARGGPGDRRALDRDVPGSNPGPAGVPVMAPLVGNASRGSSSPDRARTASRDRTIVPSGPGSSPFTSPARASVGIAFRPDAGETSERVAPEPLVAPQTLVAAEPLPDDAARPPTRGTALERMLRGEHRAMVEVVDAIAGAEGLQRRDWELLLGGLVEGMADMATRESVVDFPMGAAFWDTFTIEQCRRILGALASMGYRYDGDAGWVDSRVPAYRDLAQALADVGIEPRRIRAWPNQAEIANLLVGVRPAPEELLAAAGPEYRADEVRALLGDRGPALDDLWVAWDSIRPILLAEGTPSAV